MDEIIELRKKLKRCKNVSFIFLLLAVVILISEFIVAQYFAGNGWALPILRVLIYSFYIVPFGIVIPWFFMVNYKNKLSIALKDMNRQE